MTFSCTGKVLEKVKKYRKISDQRESVGLHNWYVNLINLERKNHLLFTNSLTLFSFFIYAGTKKELNNIEQLFEKELKEQVERHIGSNKDFIQILLPENADYKFTKTNSSSILGSMNDFKNQIKVQVLYRGPLKQTQELITQLMNECPMGGIGYLDPVTKMKQALEERKFAS